MKGMKRTLALVLSAAVAVTSISVNWEMTSYAAAPEAGAETGDAASKVASLISWQTGNFAAEDGYTVTGNALQRTEEFYSASMNNSYDDIYAASPNNSDNVIFDAAALAALWADGNGPAAEDISVMDLEFSYQWQKIGEDGNYVDIPGETDQSYTLYDDVTNAKLETKYRCVETLTGISGTNLPTGEGIEPIQLIFEKVYRYTGPTEDKVNDGTVSLEQYFIFGEEAFPTAPQTLYYESTGSSVQPSYDSYEFEKSSYDNKVSYQWNAYAVRADGESQAAKAKVFGEENKSYIDSRSLPFRYDFTVGDTTETRQVDYYELSVDFMYGSQKLATRTVRYDVRVDAIRLNTPAENSFSARKGETKKLSVDAELVSDEIGNLTYQWYKVPASGQPQLLEQFSNSDTVYVKVDDYTAKYKCVVSADRMQEAFPGVVMQEISCMFTPEESAGYRLKAINERPHAVLGGPAELSIQAVADTGYTLEYKWEKASYQDNDSSNGIIYTPIAGQTTATCKIAATTADDFKSVYDGNFDNGDGASYTHRLTVSVKRGAEKIGGDAYYYFRLTEDEENPYKITCNFEDGDTLAVEKGQDAELICKTEGTASYTLENTWYKVQEIEFVAKKDANGDYVYKTDGSVEYELADPSITVPATADKTEEFPYEYTEDPKTGNYIYVKKRMTYYTKLAATDNNSTLKLSGANDIRGLYLAEVKVTEKAGTEQTVVDTWTETYSVTLVYETDLKAYAKTSNVKAAIGGTALFEVVASNKNETLYPIQYQWQKKNAAGEYENIAGATAKSYTKSGLKQEDFGEYRVQVSDISGAKRYARFLLKPDGQSEPVFHTPRNSYYKKSIGESAELEVKADIPASVTVAYTWYRTEKYIMNYEPMYWGNQEIVEDADWQILNVETAKYTAALSTEDDFGTYRCVARYQADGAYVEVPRYFHIENAANEILLERTTPSTQYKQLGDSVSYGVRYKTISTAIKESDVKYQWYGTDGEEIPGAQSATYTVASLEAKDVGMIYCEVTYSETNLPKRVNFTTNVYSEVKAGGDAFVTGHVGDDIILKAEVVNPANRPLTYQWEFDSENYLESNDGKIYGATSDSYTIAKIGENQFGRYTCRIYDGDLMVASYNVYVERESEDDSIEIADYVPSVSVITGKQASFQVDAKSLNGQKLSYQWEYCNHEDDDYDYDDDDYIVIHNYKAIGGAVEASYSIPYALPSMEGTYRCIIKDEKGNTAYAEFDLKVGSGLEVDSGSKYEGDTVGHQTTIGGSVTLKANAKIGEGYEVYYQWFKLDDEDDDLDSRNVIYNATANELKLTDIQMEDIGYYVCRVTDAQSDSPEKYLRYQVYINTGLVVEPSVGTPVQAADGSLTMFVQAKANKGEKISYQWKKAGEIIPNATASSYKISKILKESLGNYSCTVSTSGESYTYDYNVATMFSREQSREYALQGDSFTMNMGIINAATDAAYTYQWYAQDAVTGAQMRTDCKTAKYSGKAPSIKMGSSLEGYVPLKYICEVYRDGELEFSDSNYTLKVLPEITYSTSVLPQTNHPFDKRVDVKAYKLAKAKNIKITLDKKSDWVTVVDADGHAHFMSGLTDNVLTLAGNSAIFIMKNSSPGTALGYGYKVASIVDANPVTVKPVPAKGKKYKVGNLSYQVTKSHAKSGTVSVIGAKNKKVTSVKIPDTVKIGGYTFKVTKVAAKAFSGYKKLKDATVGKNVTAIDKEAFKGCSALAKITIKGTKLKSVGKNALKGIKANAKVKVPSSKLKAYQKLFKGKGQGKKVKIQK